MADQGDDSATQPTTNPDQAANPATPPTTNPAPVTETATLPTTTLAMATPTTTTTDSEKSATPRQTETPAPRQDTDEPPQTSLGEGETSAHTDEPPQSSLGEGVQAEKSATDKREEEAMDTGENVTDQVQNPATGAEASEPTAPPSIPPHQQPDLPVHPEVTATDPVQAGKSATAGDALLAENLQKEDEIERTINDEYLASLLQELPQAEKPGRSHKDFLSSPDDMARAIAESLKTSKRAEKLSEQEEADLAEALKESLKAQNVEDYNVSDANYCAVQLFHL